MKLYLNKYNAEIYIIPTHIDKLNISLESKIDLSIQISSFALKTEEQKYEVDKIDKVFIKKIKVPDKNKHIDPLYRLSIELDKLSHILNSNDYSELKNIILFFIQHLSGIYLDPEYDLNLNYNYIQFNYQNLYSIQTNEIRETLIRLFFMFNAKINFDLKLFTKKHAKGKLYFDQDQNEYLYLGDKIYFTTHNDNNGYFCYTNIDFEYLEKKIKKKENYEKLFSKTTRIFNEINFEKKYKQLINKDNDLKNITTNDVFFIQIYPLIKKEIKEIKGAICKYI